MTSTAEPTGLEADTGDEAPGRERSSGDLRVATIVACGAAVAMSLWGLEDRALWLDEATSVGATNVLLETLRATAANMGLYYVLLDGWTAVLGTSVWAVRSLSLLFAVLTIVAFRPVASRLLGPRAAVAALGGLALAPGLTRYAQEARSYTLVMLLTTLTWGCAVRAVEAHHADGAPAARRWWFGLAAIAPLGVLAHGLFVLQLAGLAISLLVLPTRRVMLRACGPALVGAGAVLLLLASIGASDIADWVPPLAWSQVGDLVDELVAPATVAAVALIVLVGLGTIHAIGDRSMDPVERWRRRVPVAWGLVPSLLLIVVSVARPYLIPRYVVASLPGLVLLAVVGGGVAARWISRTRLPRQATAIGGVAVVVGVLAAGQIAVHQRQTPDWRGATEHVAVELRSHDAVLVPFSPIRMPFEAAWGELDPRPSSPTMLSTPRPLGEVRRVEVVTSPDEIGPDAADVDRIWIIHKRTHSAGDTPLHLALELDPLRTRFDVTERTSYRGGIEIVLLTRR